MSGPLSRVLGAFSAGAASLDEVAKWSGLDRRTVADAVENLVAMGRLEARALTSGCPSGGCGTCASGTADGHAGCGTPGPSVDRQGRVLVELRVRR